MANWASDVSIALEFENNVTNTGNGTGAFTNNGVGYSSSIYHNGAYSIGKFTTTTGVTNDSAITDTIKTVDMWYYPTSADAGTWRIITEFTIGGAWFLVEPYTDNYLYVYKDGWGSSLKLDLITHDQWNNISITIDGTNVKVYQDNVYKGQTADTNLATNSNWKIGYGTAIVSHYASGYIDNLIMSTNVYTSFPVNPLTGIQYINAMNVPRINIIKGGL